MRRLFWICIVLLILFFAAFIVDSYYPYLDYIKGFGKEIKEFSGAITAIVAIFNILFVVSFRSIDTEKRKKDAILDRKSFWFRDVILTRNFENLNNLDIVLRNVSKISVNSRDQNYMMSIIEQFQGNKRILGHSLFDALRMIDSKISEKLHNMLDDLEDFFTIQLEEVFTCPEEQFSLAEQELRIKFTTYKNDILKSLYNFEMNGYVYSDKKNNKPDKLKLKFWNSSKKSVNM